ncbi:helix-turn-helix transcriptional regulator [uncultured Selenomonas sp.]|jgi:hypothetical protein|uniref:helix-turn-helix domain-containing protein n=1 Tax=uncultured Selenomonas sp. TaxID=159275 RepID=UPI0028DB2550|nr:helix-turn-helix transcriptional regulator [uncultured Selenomonas sp.]
MSCHNFGEFIAKKRLERRITLRKMAEMLDCSATFLSDIEKDRRNPLDMERMEKLSQILALSEEERNEMLDLAGRKRNSVAPDLPDYIMNRSYVSAALRTARDLNAGEAEWQKFIDDLEKRSRS